MECWLAKSREKKRKKLIDDSFLPWKKKKSNRREGETWQIALWTHWRSWIVNPGAQGTSNRPSNDWWNQIARKRYWPWQKFALLDDRVVTWLVPLGPWTKKYRPSYEILDPWNLSGFVGRWWGRFLLFCIDSFPRGWLFVAISLFYAAISRIGSSMARNETIWYYLTACFFPFLCFLTLNLSLLFNDRRAYIRIVTCILTEIHLTIRRR